MFGAANVWIFSYNLIRGAAHAGKVEGSCILITPFDVVVFAMEVFLTVVVDVIDYDVAFGSNIIPAQVACVINEWGCLGRRYNILEPRRQVIIEGDRVLIWARGTN